jgi:hypothetical protein
MAAQKPAFADYSSGDFRLPNKTVDPVADLVVGQLWVNTVTGLFRIATSPTTSTVIVTSASSAIDGGSA